jgi:hypothetical protein
MKIQVKEALGILDDQVKHATACKRRLDRAQQALGTDTQNQDKLEELYYAALAMIALDDQNQSADEQIKQQEYAERPSIREKRALLTWHLEYAANNTRKWPLSGRPIGKKE